MNDEVENLKDCISQAHIVKRKDQRHLKQYYKWKHDSSVSNVCGKLNGAITLYL